MKNNNQDKEDILHSGRLGTFSASAAKYTSSIDIDVRLIRAVVRVNEAHILMLTKQEILNSSVAARLLRALSKIPDDMDLKEVLEDVHMNVEDYVISETGKSVGGMLNLAKSRNDQVATALRMALRSQLIVLGKSLLRLQEALLSQAEKNASTIMPGYTHLQRAQPVCLGHHLLAHFDALDRDFARLIDCYLRVNSSPMGAGALAGSSYRIDRQYEADLLGFDSLVENSLDAVSARDFATESIYLCAQVMTDLSRLSEEIILWTTKEFSFGEISDRFSSTSSMMPQKKNAIVPEIGRAKTSQVVGELVGALGILKSLPLSYNLDLQELTRNLWSAVDKTISSLVLHAEMISEMKFNKDVMKGATEIDNFLFATELADHLVKSHSLPFREAHGRVALLVKYCSEQGLTRNQFSEIGEQKLNDLLGVSITIKEVEDITSPEKVLRNRTTIGFPNPELVKRSCKQRSRTLIRHDETLQVFQDKILRSDERTRNESKKAIHFGGKSVKMTTESFDGRENAAEVKH